MEMESKFFWMQVFLGGNFREQVLEEKILLGATFGGGNWGSKNFWREFWRVKFHSGKQRKLGSKNVLERNDMGSKILGVKE